MKQKYSILQREVNSKTGKIKVKVCKSGTVEEIAGDVNYCKLRSLFNKELAYYVSKLEDSKEAIKKLKNKKVAEKDKLYIEIK